MKWHLALPREPQPQRYESQYSLAETDFGYLSPYIVDRGMLLQPQYITFDEEYEDQLGFWIPYIPYFVDLDSPASIRLESSRYITGFLTVPTTVVGLAGVRILDEFNTQMQTESEEKKRAVFISGIDNLVIRRMLTFKYIRDTFTLKDLDSELVLYALLNRESQLLLANCDLLPDFNALILNIYGVQNNNHKAVREVCAMLKPSLYPKTKVYPETIYDYDKEFKRLSGKVNAELLCGLIMMVYYSHSNPPAYKENTAMLMSIVSWLLITEGISDYLKLLIKVIQIKSKLTL